jgi:hypothetical protein
MPMKAVMAETTRQASKKNVPMYEAIVLLMPVKFVADATIIVFNTIKLIMPTISEIADRINILICPFFSPIIPNSRPSLAAYE